MMWTSIDGWIVVAGILSACSCALLGCFLLLRKMSMMGDAISHAVLPGLAAAFILTGSRSSLAMFLGAAGVGLLTALFVQWINRFGKLDESASMGVVFTGLFAVGLILIVRAARDVDLDPNCVLYGAIELVPLDTWTLGSWRIPRALVVLSLVCLLNGAVVWAFFKELTICAFDEDLATALGYRAAWMHYLLMTLVAVTTVACFESVGSILVIAMLIVPPATAHLLTDRMKPMILVSLVVAAVGAAGGHLAAITVPRWWGFSDTNTSGMMAVVSGCIFFLSFLSAPRHGVISKWIYRTRISLRTLGEDILGLLYRIEEFQGTRPPLFEEVICQIPGSGRWTRKWVLRTLLAKGQIRSENGRVQLTETGRVEATGLIRSHRLWETYFYRNVHLPIDHVHAPAERLEHVTDRGMREALEKTLRSTFRDPQGKKIPSEEPGP